jgi:hypothetical protein
MSTEAKISPYEGNKNQEQGIGIADDVAFETIGLADSVVSSFN